MSDAAREKSLDFKRGCGQLNSTISLSLYADATKLTWPSTTYFCWEVTAEASWVWRNASYA